MQDMVKLIEKLSYRHSKHKVFSDFAEMSAISFSNVLDKGQFDEREKRYLDIVKKYNKDEINEFPKLLGMLVNHLEEAPRDVMGELFHALELHNERKGQFFTPYPICRMMAKMVLPEDREEIIARYGFININEPTCGTGAMVIAAAHELLSRDINYQQVIHVTASDIDSTCVHAAYVQFSLLHIPAIVVHSDVLSLEEWSQWYTPAHIIGGWDRKLKLKHQFKKMQEIIQNITTESNTTIQSSVNFDSPNHKPTGNGTQLTIF